MACKEYTTSHMASKLSANNAYFRKNVDIIKQTKFLLSYILSYFFHTFFSKFAFGQLKQRSGV